jgi:hypothetical protein
MHGKFEPIFNRQAIPTDIRGHYCSHGRHSEHWRTAIATLRHSTLNYKIPRTSIALPQASRKNTDRADRIIHAVEK